jgi:hypothetical protein
VVPYPGFQQDSFPLPIASGRSPGASFRSIPEWHEPSGAPAGTSLGRYSELGSSAASIVQKQNLSNAYNERFNVSIQRRSSVQIVLDFTYFPELWVQPALHQAA